MIIGYRFGAVDGRGALAARNAVREVAGNMPSIDSTVGSSWG
jgi:hypothetical protein